MKQDFNENEFETTLDALIDFLNCLPKATVKLINIPRYKTLMQAAAQLTDLLRQTMSDGELTVNINDRFNAGFISVELEELSVESPLAFNNIVCKADNFEIYPLTNGNIRLNIAFYGVLKNIA